MSWIVAIVVRQVMRADRRAQLDAQAKSLEDSAVRIDATRPGAAADRAIEVGSASQIEPRAEREPCPRCGGRFHVETHEAQTDAADASRTIRHVVCRCGTCGTARATWFRIRAPTARPEA